MQEEILQLWAKKSDEFADCYPLIFHMLDTVAVCEEIWEKCLQKSTQQFMAKELGLSSESARQLVSFMAGLHDIGKASPGFQSKIETAKQELEKLGFNFENLKDIPHGIVSASVLPELLQGRLSPQVAKKIAVALGGHHGVFPDSTKINRMHLYLGTNEWQNVRQALYFSLGTLYGIKDLPVPSSEPGNAFYMLLAGLTSVADWIASNETFFPYKTEPTVEEHLNYAKGKALEALDRLGWTGWKPATTTVSVQELFPFIKDVRPLQQEAITLAAEICGQPGLVIIEAPMGEGKTEAAIYLADNWVKCLGQKGYYFALPTMATSDQMFGRVEDYLIKRYPGDRVNFMLLHGHAALSAEFETLKNKFEVQNVSADDNLDLPYDNVSAGVIASEWFTYRKRGLLAPFGVGTIDQALLGVLHTRHVFVRLFGLAHKTIIIDEVHAYDAYMSTLLARLLEWLAALGSSVVLLSATLPKARRDSLLTAYVKGIGKEEKELPLELSQIKYPRISWTDGSELHAKTIGTSPDSTKELQIQLVSGDLPENGGEYILGKQLQEALADGGCAAVICNTVDQAQKVYQALKPYFPIEDAGDGSPELDLLHARYLYGDRKKREERTLLRFGKPSEKICVDEKMKVNRPKRAVQVATQIIEQSLDIDFDMMVTEMAPTDLLLQRSGRMHRHKRDNRSASFVGKLPALWICQPNRTKGVPDFGTGTEAVYDYHILLRSWLDIENKSVVKIPEDIEALVEAIYDEKRECPAGLSEVVKLKWEESKRKQFEDLNYEKGEAENRYIKWPGFSGHLGRMVSDPREEDDPTLHPAHQALTRLTGLTVNVICLYGNSIEAFWDKKQAESLDLNLAPNNEIIRKLLEHSVSVTRFGLTETIIQDDKNTLPVAWRKTALLRHHRILFFNEQGSCLYGSFQIILDDETGLIISKRQ